MVTPLFQPKNICPRYYLKGILPDHLLPSLPYNFTHQFVFLIIQWTDNHCPCLYTKRSLPTSCAQHLRTVFPRPVWMPDTICTKRKLFLPTLRLYDINLDVMARNLVLSLMLEPISLARPLFFCVKYCTPI